MKMSISEAHLVDHTINSQFVYFMMHYIQQMSVA